MVTGEPPFSGSTHMEVLQKHVGEPLVPARERFAAVPEAASRLIDRMMAKSPAERFASARDVLVAVAEVKKVLRSGIRPAIRPEKGAAADGAGAANRRRFRRIAADFVAEISAKKASGELAGKLAARIRDISEGGLFVESERIWPPGTIIEAGFRIRRESRPVRVVGIVRWVKDEPPGAGMGLEFVRMPGASARPIGRLLTEAESAGALSRLTVTDLHRRLLRHYYDNRGDSATLAELAGRTGASLQLVRPVLREFEQHGLIALEGEMVTFVPPEDANLRRALDTWRLQERARE
jgi:hypothetical protein